MIAPCAYHKSGISKRKKQITDTPNTRFEIIPIDTFGRSSICNGFHYILIIQCELTKFAIAYPIPRKNAKPMTETFDVKISPLKVLKSAKGTEFTNKSLNNICKLLKIKSNQILLYCVSPSNIRW